MSRYRFGVWGLGLDEDAFAAALAGAGNVHEEPDGRVEFRMPMLPPILSPAEAAARWTASAGNPKQIAVTDAGSFDPLWLASTLQRANPEGGVYFRRDEPAVSVAWQWPLRIGLFADDAATDLRTALHRSSMSGLVQFVEVGREEAECELLLIPCNLRASVERVLAAKAAITADCVIVLGGAKIAADRIDALMSVLRGEVRTAGVALASVPKPARAQWFRAFIANLSHSATIDRALGAAARETKIAAPLLVCSAKLAEAATLRQFVERLGGAMQSASRSDAVLSVSPHSMSQLGLPQCAPVESIGVALESMAGSYDYRNESGDATAVVETRAEAERVLARRLEVPRMTSREVPARSPSPAPAPRGGEPVIVPETVERGAVVLEAPAAEPERFAAAHFYDPSKCVRQTMLLPRTPYFLRVHIGPKEEAGAVADVAFDESKLPPSTAGHELTIALFELRDDDHAPSSPPARATIFLPPRKDQPSEFAWFPVFTPAGGTFTARIVVLHQTRVMQTLLLRAPLGVDETEFELIQENVIRPTFEVSGTRRAFDAALVVNKAGGKTAVMGVTATSVAYNEPEGFAASIEAIGKIIGELTTLPDAVKLENKKVLSVMIRLAQQGNLLWNWIAEKLPPELATAERIQLIEARLGAFLPLEFVYPSYAPKKTATLCPHGKQELAAPRKTKCPNERDREFICPSVFWGFSRIIERWPHMDIENNYAYQLTCQLSVPKSGGPRLQPLECALLGASNKVRPVDVAGAEKAVKALMKSKLHVVKNWESWPDAVETYSPSMLILFPHSEEEDGIPALEIGREFLQVSSLEADYIRPEGRDPGPLVLLLGCSTKLPRVAFHNFVSRFRMKGASVVVGTLSLILGRHATRCVKELLGVMQKRAKEGESLFGDVLLETKQTMLAAGNPFALTLVAYGDADWRL